MFPLSLISLFAASTTAVPPVSKFVVPNFKDLTIKTRTTWGMGERNSTTKEGGNTIVKKRELIEFSERPLDPSLFEVPSDYSPAQLPKTHGFGQEPGMNDQQ
jgi:hypothetical protein